jgi:hypothetical protein
MDLFIQAFLSFGGYLMLTYFIYNILNHNRTIPLFIFGILFITQFSQLISLIRVQAPLTIIIYAMMSYLAPVIVAFLVFLRLTGGFGLPKYRRERKLKSISTDVETIYQHRILSSILGSSGVIFGSLAYFFIPGWTKWLIVVIGVVVAILGTYLLLKELSVQHESVLLIVGRQEKRYYEFIIPSKKMRVSIPEFFTNDNYIVDPIGKIIVSNESKKMGIYHVYWIATQDAIDMKNEHQLTQIEIPFETYMDQFEKYHYRIIHLHQKQSDQITLVSIKQIK